MELKDVKQQFFAYRNGMLADRLREAGDGHSVIFGLNLPQIVDIAKQIGADRELSEQLWANDTTRESRLIAPMIYPVAEFSKETAKNWIDAVENTEVADVLCHRLLKYTAYAETLCSEYSEKDNDLLRYLAYRLALNLLVIDKVNDMATLRQLAEKEKMRNCRLTQQVVLSILEECEQ